MKKIEYIELEEFKKDFKKLAKRYSSLEDDIKTAKKNAIELFHILGHDNNSVEQIPGLGNEQVKIYKMVKFACKSLKGSGKNSGIRIIYSFEEANSRVKFIEMYYKGDKELEDRERIKKYVSN